MAEHLMLYRAGTYSLANWGLRDAGPHWYCSCGGWTFAAVANPRAKTGNNLTAAKRAFAVHAHLGADR